MAGRARQRGAKKDPGASLEVYTSINMIKKATTTSKRMQRKVTKRKLPRFSF
ncbi:hypothetical protein [Lachnoclostridium sp. An118]|uniref:hypothetical protein n=1 Tax=Lachnoclostridium sp. An118 TaxID=1965547 RepID=UPI0013A6336F|nr:hypothetical protein [Lachnoclostridium sp. An118]